MEILKPGLFTNSREKTVKDIDGNTYKTIKIGNQEWMAENLKVTHYRNGDQIPYVTDNYDWRDQNIGAYCYYMNNAVNAAIYGGLYNWYAVKDGRKIAPIGWHIPTDKEWTELEQYLGSNPGGKLKEIGTTRWNFPNIDATNETNFSALPNGTRSCNGKFEIIVGDLTLFWSATEHGSNEAWYRTLSYDASNVYRNHLTWPFGFSVRCIRD